MAAPMKDDSKEGGEKSKEEDAELDALLDSALADFGNEEGQKQKPAEAAGGDAATSQSSHGDAISDAFSEEFSDEMSKHFEEAMRSVLEDDPEMMAQINKLAEAADQAGDNPTLQKEFGETLKETLSSLAHNTEGLQDHDMGEDEMMKMFAGMGLNGEGAGEGFMPMMQGMMKTLLSKEVLYPSLKEINTKYPKWIEDNKDNKDVAADMNNYKRQHELISVIIGEFEAEKETDTNEEKGQRFEKVMDLMQQPELVGFQLWKTVWILSKKPAERINTVFKKKGYYWVQPMQDLGQPPKEIVGDMAPGLQFDQGGLPVLPGSPEGCAVM